MKESPVNIVQSADRLTGIRHGDVAYNTIKKKELWQLLQILIERPALGLEDTGDERSFREESCRILKVCLSPEGIDPAAAVSIVGGSLNYDTLLVLNQITHQHIAALADARRIVYARPGEIEDLTETVKMIVKEAKKNDAEAKNFKIEVNLDTFMEMFQHLLSLASAADSILELVDIEESEEMEG